MPDPIFLRVHVWVREAKRADFAAAIGDPVDGVSVPFANDGSGPAWQWDQFVSGSGVWYGASTQWRSDIAQSVMAAAAGTEAWYVAFLPGTDVVLGGNFDPIPVPSRDFWECSAALGLVYVEPTE